MSVRSKLLLTASVFVTCAWGAGEQVAVADAVKWLHLPALQHETGITTAETLSARVSDMMVESHRARYRIAVEALAQPGATRAQFVAENVKRLSDKVRAHMTKQLASQTGALLNDAKLVATWTTAVHSGIRAAQNQVRGLPVRKLLYAPVPRALLSWDLRMRDWWRKYNAVSAIRDWRAARLLRANSLETHQLQRSLEADMERFMAQIRSTMAEFHTAPTPTPIHPAAVEAPKKRFAYLKHLKNKLGTLKLQ